MHMHRWAKKPSILNCSSSCILRIGDAVKCCSIKWQWWIILSEQGLLNTIQIKIALSVDKVRINFTVSCHLDPIQSLLVYITYTKGHYVSSLHQHVRVIVLFHL